MFVMAFREAHGRLCEEHRAELSPADEDILIKVSACAVCRTDIHIQDAELPGIDYPVVPGHQVVGEVVAAGRNAVFAAGQRVGVAWLGWTCGECEYCTSDRENLCDRARFHGYHLDGGYADHMLANSRYCFALETSLVAAATAAEIAPLLCAGLIGFRSLRAVGDARRIGIYGFGSAAHIITQVATREGREIYAFTRTGDTAAQSFALELGAIWSGGSESPSPERLDAAIIFAPDGKLVPKALVDLKKGGSLVCGGIHMSDIPQFPYANLWGERSITSIANLTRADGRAFMSIVNKGFLKPRIKTYPLREANTALDDLRRGVISGSAVLVMD